LLVGAKVAAKIQTNWLKIGAGILLSAPVGFIFISIYSFNARISATEKGIETIDKTIDEQKDKINQIHWYLIEKNNVVVPDKVKNNE
jgi:hypothetical protein